jgi:hypothetical protein
MGPELSILCAVERAELREATQVFFMNDGVLLAGDARLSALIDAGLDATVCAMDAEARGVVPVDGVRLGSQDDHARMLRSASRFLAITGAPNREWPGGQHVAVQITRPSKTEAALRSAVGYAAAGLRVTVVAPSLLAHSDHSPAVLRALGTLRGLGHAIVEQPVAADVEIAW